MALSKVTKYFSRVLTIAASVSLLCMMMVITINVIGRIFFGTPLLGAIEIAGLMGVVFVAVALSHTERERGNVAVEALVMLLPERVRAIMDAVTLLLSLVGVSFLSWAVFNEAFHAADFQERTLVLEIQTTPFKFIWAIGTLLLCLFVLKNAITSIKKALGK